MGGGAGLGPEQPKQTSQWGWAASMGAIPMQPAASFPQAKGRQGTEGRWQIDSEGALRGETTEMRKHRTQQAERAGPPEHQRLLRARNDGATP